jgi:hypothetical protein
MGILCSAAPLTPFLRDRGPSPRHCSAPSLMQRPCFYVWEQWLGVWGCFSAFRYVYHFVEFPGWRTHRNPL